jgi:hypothetical protein
VLAQGAHERAEDVELALLVHGIDGEHDRRCREAPARQHHPGRNDDNRGAVLALSAG